MYCETLKQKTHSKDSFSKGRLPIADHMKLFLFTLVKSGTTRSTPIVSRLGLKILRTKYSRDSYTQRLAHSPLAVRISTETKEVLVAVYRKCMPALFYPSLRDQTIEMTVYPESTLLQLPRLFSLRSLFVITRCF